MLLLSKAFEGLGERVTMGVGVTCFLGPIVIESVHSAAPGHWVRGEETSYLRILGISEKVEVWCELESVAGVMEDFVVQGDFTGLVGGRGLSEE